ncbi:MAG: Na/Pi cotransporter family protein [Betaproteobacteria bacterium]|nr:Na/Pi cotransporter family protein [Betaproteobacteria bacterium]
MNAPGIDWSLVGGVVGGMGLFLLGMSLMTDGLKLAAGSALERILAKSTETRLRALLSGVLITAFVQSSSAVTMAAIGFINAGLLSLGQIMWVLFGANVGSSMTGWLVALVGMRFEIDAFALPMVGVGMLLRLTGPGTRRAALGLALAGLGLLFLGLDLFIKTFSGLHLDFALPQGDTAADVLLLVLVGIGVAMLVQSSSATLAVALTAAQGGLLSQQGAAAVVIGANIGTTVTAVLVVINATANAKRAAAAQVMFNLVAAVAALALLPWLLAGIAAGRAALGFESVPAAELALFHTLFNLLGVVLIWPVTGRFTNFLESRFRDAEEDEARPRFLDQTVATVPVLALDALDREVRRMGAITLRLARGATAVACGKREALERDERIVERLNLAIAEFITRLNRGGMAPASAARLPRILRVARYYETAADLALEATTAACEVDHAVYTASSADFHGLASEVFVGADPLGQPIEPQVLEGRLAEMEQRYQLLKAELLEAGAAGTVPVVVMDARLRSASALHRAAQQMAKAARALSELSREAQGRHGEVPPRASSPPV